VTRTDVARVLAEIATLGELNGDNPFRTRAFASAARALEGTDVDLGALAREGALTSLPGIGPAIAETIQELVETGRSSVHDELKASTPIGLYDLLRIPGVGAKRIHTLHTELGIDSLDSLEAAARAGNVAQVSGFGAKTERKILDGIAFVRAGRGQRRYPAALEVAVRLLQWLRAQPDVASAEIAGALRRRSEVVDAVELVAASTEPHKVVSEFAQRNGAARAAEQDAADPEAHVTIHLSDSLPVRLRCVAADRFVAAMVWETGSDSHLRQLGERAESRGMRLDADGLWRADRPVPLSSESALYAALELAYVPPELREGLGEIDVAAADSLPKLVELADLRGTFHCHTSYSDGKATVAEMAEAARALGWSYLGIADHSPAAAYAGGLSVARVREQHREIDEWNAKHGGQGPARFRIFKGTESDILPDGSLDFPDSVLASFDYVVGSVHSSFGLPEKKMTARVIRAIQNPHLTMLGHATGRLLLTRDAYAIDVRAVIDAAAEHGVAVEINADPIRLDLDWRHVRYAAERGVLIPINPDAHSTRGLENVAFGINVARKGLLEPSQVLNTWTLDRVEEYFATRKQKG
jgi:DNA polymerase (family 10)